MIEIEVRTFNLSRREWVECGPTNHPKARMIYQSLPLDLSGLGNLRIHRPQTVGSDVLIVVECAEFDDVLRRVRRIHQVS